MANLLRGLGAALVALLLLGVPQAVASTPSPTPPLGGAVLHYLPAGLGSSSDFEYQFARVSFASRVWESGSDVAGWRVDLHIIVMHGARLRTPQALHDWFIRYEQRPPAEARYVPMRMHGRRGWVCRDQVFWLERQGVAVSVQIDRSRWSKRALLRTARGVRVPWFPPFPLMTETGTRSSLIW